MTDTSGLSLSGAMPLSESISEQVESLPRVFARGVILGSLLFAFSPGVARGETVAFQGRSFEVDRLVALPDGQATVEVDGQIFLASEKSVGQRVFRFYAENPQLLPAGSIDSAYGTFVASLSQGDALTAIQGVLLSDEVPEKLRGAFFAGLGSSDKEGDLLVTALRRVGGAESDPRIACIALPYLSPRGIAEVQKLLSSDLSWIARVCPRKLVQMAQDELIRGDRDRGASLLSFVGSFFKGRSEIAQAAEASAETLRIVRESFTSSDADRFESALRGASFDPLIRDYYQTSQGDFIAEFSSHALSTQQPAAALRGLSDLDFAYRDNRHHELMLQAIRSLQFNDATVLSIESVRRMLWAYSTKDPGIKDEYVSLLRSFVEEAIQNGNPAQGASYLDILKDIRVDPSPDNDELRGLLAEGFVDSDDLSSAENILNSVRTSIPWIIRFRLLLKLDRYVLLMVLLGFAVVVRWMVKIAFKRGTPQIKRNQDSTKHEGSKARKGKARGARKKFKGVDANLKKSTYKGLDEYNDCLAKFNLQPGASLAEIKNAYRVTVKSLHPDMNPNATKDDTTRFIELTKTYERLLALHEERLQRGDKSPDSHE